MYIMISFTIYSPHPIIERRRNEGDRDGSKYSTPVRDDKRIQISRTKASWEAFVYSGRNIFGW